MFRSSAAALRSLAGDTEMRLLAACVRPLADERRLTAIRAAVRAPIDGERLALLARRHRVQGFAEQGLAAAGVTLAPAAAARLAAGAASARLQTLRNAGEEVRVGQAMAAAGIDALFVKGATLGMRLHGSLGIKTSWDVDLLVAPDRVAGAGAVLEQLGYGLHVFGRSLTDPVKVGRYLAAHKETEWTNAARGTVVELHTGLSDNAAAIRTVGLASPRDTVAPMPGAPLQTLATAPLFAYLVHHGSSHLWARLKWLADVAALLHGADLAALHDEAVALGAGRTPGLAILLAHELLDLAVPEPLLAAIRRDRGTRRLLRYSAAAIAAPETVEGHLARPLRELAAYARAQAWLAPDWRHRWGAMRIFLTRPYLPHHLAVPRWALPVLILGALPVRLLRRPARLRREERAARARQAGGKVASSP